MVFHEAKTKRINFILLLSFLPALGHELPLIVHKVVELFMVVHDIDGTKAMIGA